jgi:hypothetical protein
LSFQCCSPYSFKIKEYSLPGWLRLTRLLFTDCYKTPIFLDNWPVSEFSLVTWHLAWVTPLQFELVCWGLKQKATIGSYKFYLKLPKIRKNSWGWVEMREGSEACLMGMSIKRTFLESSLLMFTKSFIPICTYFAVDIPCMMICPKKAT